MCDYILHGVILKNAYLQTAQLWRTEPEMKRMFGWLLLGQLITAVMFCAIYAFRRTRESCAGQGTVFGFLGGLLLCSLTLITYAVQPIPAGIIGTWIVGDLIICDSWRNPGGDLSTDDGDGRRGPASRCVRNARAAGLLAY
jgi:hypothetical protein